MPQSSLWIVMTIVPQGLKCPRKLELNPRGFVPMPLAKPFRARYQVREPADYLPRGQPQPTKHDPALKRKLLRRRLARGEPEFPKQSGVGQWREHPRLP